ncbi:MAG: RNB domain-containing ribonuclease [Rickettsiales bacterium]
MKALPNIAKRHPFTAQQLYSAKAAGLMTPELMQGRRRVITHPIDNVTRETPSDRDDGIFVEAAPEGKGYRVHVTIADVAALIPLEHPQARAANERAFTVYRPEMNDPMFVKATEDRMSLEHDKERLGLTAIMDLNKEFAVTHVEFEPTIAVGDNTDYASAQERIRTDPNFALMATIARGLRKRMKSVSPNAVAEIKSERSASPTSKGEMKVRKMVEAYMLLANEQVATFLDKADLPCLFRNFEDDAVGDDGIARAYYSTRLKRHDALARDGLGGAYCHFTSPIRRGPDYYNAHMVHFVIAQMGKLENELLALYPAANREMLHKALWNFAPQFFAERNSGRARILPGGALVEELTRIITKTGIQAKEIERKDIHRIVSQLQKNKPPLTRSQLDGYASRINALNDIEHDALQSPELQRWLLDNDKRKEAQAQIGAQTAETLAAKNIDQFSTLLRKAAKFGIITPALKQAFLERLENQTLHLTQDGFNVLVVAAFPDNADWRELKRVVCRAIKQDPASVNGIFEQATREGYFSEDSLSISEANLPVDDHQALPERENSIQAAVVTLRKPYTPQVMAAPYFSVGHDGKSATSHAKYSFLEHYAFGQLQPLDQSSIPNLLYAQLNHDDSNRRQIVEDMAASVGATFRVVEFVDRQGARHVHAIVKGGKLPEAIVGRATDAELPGAEALATKRLLRMPAFKSAFNFSSLAELQSTLRPVKILEEQLARHQMKYEMSIVAEPVKGGRSKFVATVVIHDGKGTKTYSEEGPNKARAMNDACKAALADYGWLPAERIELKARSWVTERHVDDVKLYARA